MIEEAWSIKNLVLYGQDTLKTEAFHAGQRLEGKFFFPTCTGLCSQSAPSCSKAEKRYPLSTG